MHKVKLKCNGKVTGPFRTDQWGGVEIKLDGFADTLTIGPTALRRLGIEILEVPERVVFEDEVVEVWQESASGGDEKTWNIYNKQLEQFAGQRVRVEVTPIEGE